MAFPFLDLDGGCRGQPTGHLGGLGVSRIEALDL
jgi:hypothetical protein